MLYENMNISCLMVHSQQVEDTRAKRKNRDDKRERTFDSGSNQVPSKFPNSRDDRVANHMPKKGGDTSSPIKNPTC